MTPDYNSRKAISLNTSYTAASNGYVFFTGIYSGGNSHATPMVYIYVNNLLVAQDTASREEGGWGLRTGAMAPVRKGDVYKISVADSGDHGWFDTKHRYAYFIPAK